MEKIKFIEKIDLLHAEQKFKELDDFSFDGKLISFSVDDCKFILDNDSIECEFHPEKYYVVANVLLNILNTQNSQAISKLLELVGATEFSRNGQLDFLIQHYKQANDSLSYENAKLKEKLHALESSISLQEAQLSELRKKIIEYESLPDNVVSEMIVNAIQEDSNFSITAFSKKNNLTTQQVNKCLTNLIENGTVSVLNDNYYSKPLFTKLYAVKGFFTRFISSLVKKFRRKK